MTIPGVTLALQISAPQDEQLAIRLQRRDPGALADLYDRFGKLAWSVIMAIVRDADAAEDLLLETFLHVWNSVHALDPVQGAIGPWLLAIARNGAIGHLRLQRANVDAGSLELDQCEHPSLFVDMEREVLNTDHARVIRKAIAGLSENQRRVIELAYYEGLSQPEMAARMGEPRSAVRTWVRTALRHLRAELGQERAA